MSVFFVNKSEPPPTHTVTSLVLWWATEIHHANMHEFFFLSPPTNNMAPSVSAYLTVTIAHIVISMFLLLGYCEGSCPSQPWWSPVKLVVQNNKLKTFLLFHAQAARHSTCLSVRVLSHLRRLHLTVTALMMMLKWCCVCISVEKYACRQCREYEKWTRAACFWTVAENCLFQTNGLPAGRQQCS